MPLQSLQRLAMLLIADVLLVATQTASAHENAASTSVSTEQASVFQAHVSVGTATIVTKTNIVTAVANFL